MDAEHLRLWGAGSKEEVDVNLRSVVVSETLRARAFTLHSIYDMVGPKTFQPV